MVVHARGDRRQDGIPCAKLIRSNSFYMEIKLPLIQNPTGLGDVIAAATKAVGIKPCTPCQERARRLNEALRFTPRWTDPPQPAEGWTTVTLVNLPEKQVGLYRHSENHSWIVWEIMNGRYQNSYSFGCANCPPDGKAETAARAKFGELCR
jgi:hypothetical protein